MHFPTLLTSVLAIAPFVAAHGDGIPGAPKIFGRRTQDGAIGRRSASRPHHMHKRDHEHHQRSHLTERANTDGQCGKSKGSCAAGYCCSSGGWCGKGIEYCAAPDCQFNYGSGCDANTVPPGDSTSGVARTKPGNVLYGGGGIYDCTVPNIIALTYDDGPYIYTSQMLDILDKYNVKATFFVTGNNLGKGPLDNAYYPWVNIIKRMYSSGHQIASHTWSHQDLTNEVNHAQRLNQMYYLEMAVRNILGVFPTYMRPPYSSCAGACQTDMADLGYHVTYFDVDTEDYLNTLPSQIQTAKNDFIGNISKLNPAVDDALVIAHDIHQQTALNLTEYMITSALAKGWKFGTVGECLGDPKANWYRSSSGSVYTSAPGSASTTGLSSTKSSSSTTSTTSTKTGSSSTTSTAPSSSATVISLDGSCGGTVGQTCRGSTFGNCCSTSGYCGSESLYCGTGCQVLFGNCGGNGVISGSGTASSTSAAPSSSATIISLDGSCGGTTGQTCRGSTFGNCCSTSGYCGSDTAYCGTGCQVLFGNCGGNGIVSSSSSPSPSPSPSSSSISSPIPSPSSSSTSSTRSSTTSSPTSTPSSSASASPSSSSSPSSSPSSSSSSTRSSTTLSTSASPSPSSSSTSSSTSSSRSSSSSSIASSSTSSTSTRSSSTTIVSTPGPSTPSGPATPSGPGTPSSTPSPPKATAPVKSTNGNCGKAAGMTCDGYARGSCCGRDNKCGTAWDCFKMTGCQDDYGFCWF